MNTTSLRQKAYDYLHEKILRGDLSPGRQISEQSLAAEIGISRTPVREAIRQLAEEGLVVQVPRFGTIVRTPGRRELVELFQLREALEPYAVALAAQSVSAADLDLLESLCRQMRQIAVDLRGVGASALDPSALQRFLSADMAFHMLLIRAAGNRRIAKIVADSRVIASIFGAGRQTHDLGVVARAYGYHRRILHAVRRGDGEAARRWMVDHLRASMAETLEHYRRAESAVEQQAISAFTLPDDVRRTIEHLENHLES
ncbi:MAG: GntR family transcriptional regulator [Rhodopirellula sp.]|nr:GntR family transcriptional regulator [Rhodopirellula sp.]